MPIFNKVPSVGNVWGVDRWQFVAWGAIADVIDGMMLHEDGSCKTTETGVTRVIE